MSEPFANGFTVEEKECTGNALVYIARQRVQIEDLITERDKYKAQRDQLLEAAKNIISISDRKHDFYDTAKAIIQEIEQESKE